MITMNSISGGKTSAYMAYHFPADYDIFALVCSKNPLTAPRDAGLIREANSRLADYANLYGEFIGSYEHPLTLRVVLDLEQMIGRKIYWVRGDSFEDFVMKKGALPNMEWRMCTTELKIRAIAEWIYKTTGGGKVFNRVGIRIDEAGRLKSQGHRAQKIDIIIDRASTRIAEMGGVAADSVLTPSGDIVAFEEWAKRQKNKWLKDYEFAEASYPLVEGPDGKLAPHRKADIYKWAYASGLKFPPSSNCQFCFHKSILELRANCDEVPEIMEAGAQMEELFSSKKGKAHSMKKDYSLRKIINMSPIQQGNLFTQYSDMEKLSYCESTFCTD